MIIYENGIYKELKAEEIEEIKEVEKQVEAEYWQTIDYEEAVNNEIRKKYSVSQEFAILRQKEEKPQEYQEYYNYCEECKAYVKSKKEVGGQYE